MSENLAKNLSAIYPGLQVAGWCSPPFRSLTEQEDAAVVAQINATQPDVVWIGLGAPKQEKWMLSHSGRIAATALIGVGAAFDFHSGNIKRAPGWMCSLGLEWLHRLLREPWRWKRFLDLPRFLARVIGQRLTRRY